jgi:hypothetical protein
MRARGLAKKEATMKVLDRKDLLSVLYSLTLIGVVVQMTETPSACNSVGVVRVLSVEELANTFAGQQTEEGVVTSVGAISTWASGAFLAGQINSGAAFGSIGVTAGTVISGVGMFVGAYTLAEQTMNTFGNPLMQDIYNFLAPAYGVSTSGALYTFDWATSDIVYRSDLVIHYIADAWITDYYCGGIGCMCDDSGDCDTGLWCNDQGFCSDTEPV